MARLLVYARAAAAELKQKPLPAELKHVPRLATALSDVIYSNPPSDEGRGHRQFKTAFWTHVVERARILDKKQPDKADVFFIIAKIQARLMTFTFARSEDVKGAQCVPESERIDELLRFLDAFIVLRRGKRRLRGKVTR